MGLTDFKSQMCDKYNSQTSRSVSQLNNLNKLTRGPYNELRNGLMDLKLLPTTPSSILNSKLNTLSNDMKAQVPDLNNNPNDLLSMMKKCTPFKDLMNGVGSLDDAINSVIDATMNLVNDVVNNAIDTLMSGIPEFSLGTGMAGIDNLFGNIKIPDLLGNLDPLLNCLSDMCPGSSTASIIDQVNEIQGNIGFNDEGKFDTASIMQKVGLPTDKQTNLDSINNMLLKTQEDTKAMASNQVSTLFESVKKAKKNAVLGKISSFF